MTKAEKILRIAGWAIGGLQLVATIVACIFMFKINMLPTAVSVLVTILLVLFSFVTLITQHWKIPGIVTKVIGFIIAGVLLVGTILYLYPTYKGLKQINKDSDIKVSYIGVYVKIDNPAENIQDVRNAKFGYPLTDKKHADYAIEQINNDVRQAINTTEYPGFVELYEALLDDSVEAIIMNSAMESVIEDTHKDFPDKVKMIAQYEYRTKIDTDRNKDYLSADDVISLYVSGIDMDGEPTVNRNSDVNILLVINTKTHQMLMINTPRDFYVDTTVSKENGGLPDKLTHAGCYGIDCSVGTLEMLYGINIDYYFKINFTGFVDVIDYLGGVDVNSEYDFETYHGKYHIVQGMNHLTGEQALGYARERYSFGTGDRQRGKNQMEVIRAMFSKMMSSELLKNYSQILESLTSSMVTSMPTDVIGDLVKDQLATNATWDIQNYSVNGRGDRLPMYSLSAPNDVMVPDMATVDQAKAFLKQIFNNEKVDTSTAQAQ